MNKTTHSIANMRPLPKRSTDRVEWRDSLAEHTVPGKIDMLINAVQELQLIVGELTLQKEADAYTGEMPYSKGTPQKAYTIADLRYAACLTHEYNQGRGIDVPDSVVSFLNWLEEQEK